MAFVIPSKRGAGRLAVRSAVAMGVAAAMAAGLTAAAAAQQRSRSIATFYVTPQAMIDSTRQIADAVSAAVNGQLAPASPAAADALVLQYAGEGITEPAADAFTTLDGASADGDFVSTSQAGLQWNIWSDAALAFADRNNPIAGYDGVLATISLGLDRKLGDSSVLGVLMNFEATDFDTSAGPGTFDSSGYGIGLYGGTALGDHWVADAMAVWKRFDNDVSEPGPVSASFDSERWQAAANLTGYWYRDAWRTSPALGIAWSHEDQDASILNPAQTVTTTLASAGLEVGYTTALNGMRSLEPWASLTVEWTVHDSATTLLGLPDPDLNEIDLRLAGGFNAMLAENFSLSLRADVAGLARNNFLIATIGAQAALQF